MAEKNNYPFIFINHGKPIDIYSFQGEKYIIIAFKENVSGDVTKKIEKLTPRVLDGSYLWSDNMMMNYSMSDEDEIIMHYMQKRKKGFDDDMDDGLLMELYTSFANDIEEWALEIHKLAPIDFFIGLHRISGSKWDKYSEGELDSVVSKLENESKELSPRKKQIINEALQQVLQSKNKHLSNGNRNKVKDLIVITE